MAMGLHLRALHTLSGAAALALLLTACSGGGGGSGSGLSTASILGEAPASASGESPGIKRDDPMARPVQVAWTSARAQKCGFNFDATRLRANYIAYEQQQGGDPARLGNVEKTYDLTVNKIRETIGPADTYCTDKKSAVIKADLQRHLAGNYEPNFPEEKVAQGGFFGKGADQTVQDRFDPKTIWRDLEDKKNGVRRGAE
jgi:hypothetical protein